MDNVHLMAVPDGIDDDFHIRPVYHFFYLTSLSEKLMRCPTASYNSPPSMNSSMSMMQDYSSKTS